MTARFDDPTLVKEYTPLLVLYPEIGATPGSGSRVRNPDYPDDAPIQYDYHPRDIRIVLEHSSFHSRFRLRRGKTRGWEEMLRRMERGRYEKDLDLVPGVASDDRDGFWEAYASISKDGEEFQRNCYARTVEGRGINSDRILVQYWYAYFYNDFWNTHEMDWETVMIIFKLSDQGPRPTVCAYSAHMGGHWLPWSEVQKVNDELQLAEDGTHPIAYVANGSHANYFHGSAMYLTAPPLVDMAAKLLKKSRRLVDYTTSLTNEHQHLVEARLIPPGEMGDWTGEWRWLNQKGRWGSPGKFLDLEFGDAAPVGPPQTGDRWEFPFHWVVSCTRAPSQEESLVPTRVEPRES